MFALLHPPRFRVCKERKLNEQRILCQPAPSASNICLYLCAMTRPKSCAMMTQERACCSLVRARRERATLHKAGE